MSVEQIQTHYAKLAEQRFTYLEIIRLVFLKWLYAQGRVTS